MPNEGSRNRSNIHKLTLGALGVVYGDIGTSPLYALKESLHAGHGIALSQATLLGILSLFFWSLTLVIVLKYLLFVLRADNRGEGGITSLVALLTSRLRVPKGPPAWVPLLGIFGAGLLYGDGVITPSISVLSAVEGLQVATPALQPYVVPTTIVILLAIFLVQKGGTARLGAVFGPLTLLWFVTLAATGLPWILKRPDILMALNPWHAVAFFRDHGTHAFFAMSSVVLCVTGAEALYADMGHFGLKPIRRGWFAVVFPALLINYFGQGALVLEQGESVLGNTFYGLVTGWWLYPLVAIATTATIIASQAMISGAFSLTQQVIQLGYLPRMTLLHTSRLLEGQIYIPVVNFGLMISCILIVLIFQTSSNIAVAYGIAVTGSMAITSLLFYMVARRIWKWPLWAALPWLAVFLSVDLVFFGANLVKVASGGWIPILIALGTLAIMTTWKRGRQTLATEMTEAAISLDEFLKRIEKEKPARVPGTAVFMTINRDIAPSVLLHHYKHNQVLHERVLLLSILTEHEPSVPGLERVRTTDLTQGFIQVIARYGYMETPSVSEILTRCQACGTAINPEQVSFYLGRETFVPGGRSGMSAWRKRLFQILSKNARTATEFFNLPPDQVIEIGTQIRI